MENNEEKPVSALRAYRLRKQTECGKKISSRGVAMRWGVSANYVSLLERGIAPLTKKAEAKFYAVVDELANAPTK